MDSSTVALPVVHPSIMIRTLSTHTSIFVQREFEDIANHFQNHEHARLVLKYDEALSHLIYAASDMLIIPSIFEPCGLTQVIPQLPEQFLLYQEPVE